MSSDVAELASSRPVEVRKKRRGRATQVFLLTLLLCMVALPFVFSADADLYLSSDDALYNTVALDAAENVPLAKQVNPFETEYIRFAAQRFGRATVHDFGYYKLLGIYYTLISPFAEPGPPYAVALNVLLLALAAQYAYRLMTVFMREQIAFKASLLYALHPLLLEMGTFVRKDIAIALLLGVLLYRMASHKSWQSIIAVSVMLGYLRAPLLLLLAPLFVVSLTRHVLGLRRAIIITLILPTTMIASAGLDTILATFNYAAPSVDVAGTLTSDISGFGGRLLSSAWGQPLYVLFYPFPNFDFGKWLANPFRAYANVGYALTMVSIPYFVAGCKSALAAGWEQSHIVMTYVLLYGQLLTMAYLARTSGLYGLVEPRYKIMLLLPYIVLVAIGWQKRVASVRRQTAFVPAKDYASPRGAGW